MAIRPYIKTVYRDFTNAEKRVADVVLTNAPQVVYMSISDLGELANAGDATVLRFCRKIGYKSYQAMKLELSNEIGQTDHSTDLKDKLVRDGDDIDTILAKTFNNIISNLNETRELIDPNAIEKAADMFLRAKNIVVIGVGGSGIIAQDTVSKFMRIGMNINCYIDVHTQLMSASILSPEDLAVGISFSGSTKDTLGVIQKVKDNGVPVICVTHYLRSPLAKLSDLILLHGSNEGPLQGGDSSTKISQLSVIDVLYHAVYMKMGDRAREYKLKTAGAVLNKLT